MTTRVRSSISSLQLLLCYVAAVKRIPVHHYSADNIFWFFGINESNSSYFENRVLLKPVLGAWPVLHVSLLVMNRLDTTEFATFIILMFFFLPKDLTIQNLIIFTAAGVVPCGGGKTSPITSS